MGLHVLPTRFALVRMERRFHNPHAMTRFTENRLPHRQQDGITYFVTFRLADSLPKELLNQWRSERAAWMKFHPEPWSERDEAEYHRRFTAKFEGWLDEGHGSCLLRHGRIRDRVGAVLGRFDGVRYQHHAWVIMPNHVHALVSLAPGADFGKLLQAWKGASSREMKRLLPQTIDQDGAPASDGRHSCRPGRVELVRTGRQECRPSEIDLAAAAAGPIWMKDYFDRMIRDAAHFWRCARYIRRNPAKAKLPKEAFTLFESDHVRDVLDGKANG